MILAAGLVSQEVALNYSGNGYPDTIGPKPEIEVASDVLLIGLVTKLRQHIALRSHPMYWRTSLDSAALDRADD